MEKTFIGEVLTSELNEFEKEGELITLWKLTLALDETRCITFNVSKQSSPDLFNRVQDAISGMRIKAKAVAKGTYNNIIKWQLAEVELADT